MSRIRVHTLPILEDNYGYLIEDTQDQSCVVVDPGEAGPLIRAIEERGLTPVAIWNTHHHADHVAGNAEVLAHFGPLPVVGSEGDRGRVPELTRWLQAGDTLEFGGETVQVLAIPGHTLGHIAFVFPSGHIFCGDLLFGYSCGKVIEGTLEQMYESVSQLLDYPDSTWLYIGHEYTFANRKFAQHVEPDNPDIPQRIAEETSPPTVPLQLGREKRTNPFLRCHLEAVQSFTGKSDPKQAFAELRTFKDSFR